VNVETSLNITHVGRQLNVQTNFINLFFINKNYCNYFLNKQINYSFLIRQTLPKAMVL